MAVKVSQPTKPAMMWTGRPALASASRTGFVVAPPRTSVKTIPSPPPAARLARPAPTKRAERGRSRVPQGIAEVPDDQAEAGAERNGGEGKQRQFGVDGSVHLHEPEQQRRKPHRQKN